MIETPALSIDPVLAELAAIRERVESLTVHPGPLSSDDLQARGYSRDEAYSLLARHGVKVPGGRRLRIALSVLEAIERGDTPA